MANIKIDYAPEEKDLLRETHFFVKYDLQSRTNLFDAAWNLAIGQSVGNPNVRSNWETDELFTNHSCKIIIHPSRYKMLGGEVEIAFPYSNLNWKEDGISQLLCMVQGGQTDIDDIRYCKLLSIEAPLLEQQSLRPKYGISGFRSITDRSSPFLGGIIKPKTGVSPEILLEMVKEMVDGGVDFIKEDEILSNPGFCSISKRVDLISNYLHKIGSKVIYSVCINADPAYILDRVKLVHSLGGNSVHVNVWSGLGAYKSIRELDLPIFIHYQKSGVETICNSNSSNVPYSITWNALCYLAGLCGVDSIHAGMVGGYSETKGIKTILGTLRKANVIPALSCGMHPGLVESIRKEIGEDWMANVGGAMHGHPSGTKAGALAMRQAIDRTYSKEWGEAVTKWGLKC